jgi:hypothetical protein
MTVSYRAMAPDGAIIATEDSIDGIVRIIRDTRPDRYQVDVIGEDPGTGRPSSRPWGVIIRSPEGAIEFDLPPYMD